MLEAVEDGSAQSKAAAHAGGGGPRAMGALFLVRVALVLGLVLGVMTWLHHVIGVALIEHGAFAPSVERAAWLGLWAAYAALFGGLVGGRLLPRPAAKVAQWVGFGWLGAFFVLLCLVGTSELLLWLAARFVEPRPDWAVARAAAVAALAVALLAWGLRAARNPLVRRSEVRLARLPRALDGLRVVQLSDVHIGETLDGAFLQRIVEQVNRLEADLVVLTGDLVDGSVRRLGPELAPLGALRARHGVYSVTGNHEYYSGGAAWEVELSRLGLRVLHNEHAVLEVGAARLVVAGVTDLQGAQFSALDAPDLGAALRGAPEDVPRLLLAHQPRFAKRVAGHRVDLMLSGHTHGGQIFPFNLLVYLQQPVVRGLREIAGVLTYTSTGVGYWGPPFRIGARGEIAELVLRSASSGEAAAPRVSAEPG